VSATVRKRARRWIGRRTRESAWTCARCPANFVVLSSRSKEKGQGCTHLSQHNALTKAYITTRERGRCSRGSSGGLSRSDLRSERVAERHVDVTHLAAPSPVLHSLRSSSACVTQWQGLSPASLRRAVTHMDLLGAYGSDDSDHEQQDVPAPAPARTGLFSVLPPPKARARALWLPCGSAPNSRSLPVLHRSAPQNDAAQPATAPRPQPGSPGAKRVVSFLVPLKTDALGVPDEEEVSQHARRLLASLAHTHEHL
jgi:hypothetical protein